MINEGATPAAERSAAELVNPLQIMRNAQKVMDEEAPVYNGVRRYLLQRGRANRFELQDHVQATTAALLEDAEVTDEVDMPAVGRSPNIPFGVTL